MGLSRRLGLGLLVGAVLHGEAHAQVRDTTREVRVPVPPREDSLLKRDSLLQRDSARTIPPKDSIKAPLAAAEAPVLADPNGSFVWDRRDVFSTGALTVQDLLDRVPGVTGLRSGWISQPMVAGFLGDPGRVRIFLDGLELAELDPRMARLWDLTQIPLWALDDIQVERGPSEIRIHMRSWRVDRTTPFTRTDIYTGDQSTNLYRGLFGRRYPHGEVLQIAGQQFGTDPGRNIESSDQLGVLARIGLARNGWSVDAMLLRGDRNRGRTFTLAADDTIPATESTRSDAYLRVGVGTTESGPWVQAIASASKYAYGGKGETGDTTSSDTSRSESQYLLTGGYTLGPWRASFAQRVRVGMRRRIATPSARLGFETNLITLSALGEGRGADSIRRFEVSSVVRPVSFLFLAGSVGTEQPEVLPDSLRPLGFSELPRFMRGEAGLRIRDLWLSGGMMRRNAVILDAPAIFRPQTPTITDPKLDGVFVTVRGRLWKALYADAQAIQWSDSGWYRPQYQARSELYVSTSMLERFPNGNFHFLVSAVHEYRSTSYWPDAAGPQRITGYRTISTLLQFRILQAEVFWNFRNVLGERYEHVPGYRLPRLSNVYGVRWEFWN
ncbi:MAG: Plug domain-containing protein [Gemmatimonadaceae bacterium]